MIIRDIRNDFRKNKALLIMVFPVILYFLIFHYQPMYGAQIAFRNFSPAKGILGSPWVGFKHFITFFKGPYALKLIANTFLLNITGIAFFFPAPIILALLLNEVKSNLFKRAVQTITYLPHFVSLVVVCGLVIDFVSTDGLINQLLAIVGVRPTTFLLEPGWFRPIYVLSGIWQEMGWNSIVYLAALAAIDAELYDAAKIDGANRFGQMIHVTLPGILPTIITLLILRMGHMLSVGSEKVLLLYNPTIYETADVLSTFVYRQGVVNLSYSFSAAVGLFSSVVNFVILLGVNRLSKTVTETSLW